MKISHMDKRTKLLLAGCLGLLALTAICLVTLVAVGGFVAFLRVYPARTLVALDTPAFTPSPSTPSVTPTPTPRPPTPSPTPTPTPLPPPTETAPPPTATPPPPVEQEPPTNTPTPGPVYEAPRLISPPDGTIFSSGRLTEITFEWEGPDLAEDEFYNLTIRWYYGEIPHYWGDAIRGKRLQLKGPHWIYGKADKDRYEWWVVIRKRTSWTEEGKPDGPPISPDSEVWHFFWR